jgi:hypothetical protein
MNSLGFVLQNLTYFFEWTVYVTKIMTMFPLCSQRVSIQLRMKNVQRFKRRHRVFKRLDADYFDTLFHLVILTYRNIGPVSLLSVLFAV